MKVRAVIDLELDVTDLAAAQSIVEGMDIPAGALYSAELFTGDPGLDNADASWDADAGEWA